MNTSYLTITEYKRAPSAINTSNLDYFAGISDQTSQDAELANVIARASAWIDNICELPSGLAASINNEVHPVYISKDGILRVQPKNIPIIQLQSFQWRLYPTSQWTTVDLSIVQVYPRYFETMMWFPFFNGPALTIGNTYAFPLSAPYTPYMSPSQAANMEDLQLIVQYTYINGYPNTTLQNNVAAGMTSITLNDTTGIIAGTTLNVFDGANTEKITVLSAPVGNVVSLTNPLIFAHNSGIAVSAIPADVKQACILLVNYLLKERGVNAITMSGAENPQMSKYNDVRDVEMAKELLRRYRRVV